MNSLWLSKKKKWIASHVEVIHRRLSAVNILIVVTFAHAHAHTLWLSIKFIVASKKVLLNL